MQILFYCDGRCGEIFIGSRLRLLALMGVRKAIGSEGHGVG